MRVIGLAGWSGAGKTTLIEKLIPEIRRRGFSVSTLKHAHHAFDMDRPGKDSHRHREAGAAQVLVASTQRLALLTELRDAPEPRLADLLLMFAPVDFVLIEGFRSDAHAKIEIFREANGKPLRYPEDDQIVALISDLATPPDHLPHAHIDDVTGVADLVLAHAQPLEDALALLGAAVGFVIFYGLYWLAQLLYGAERVPLGYGDVKLAMLMGAMLGFHRIFFALMLGILLGGVFSLLLLLTRRVNRDTALPYGQYLALAAIVMLIWGAQYVQQFLD